MVLANPAPPAQEPVAATNIKVDTSTAFQETSDIVSRLENFARGRHGASPQAGNKQLLKLLTKAVKAYKKGDFKSAALRGLDATRVDENCAQACHVVALALDGMGQLSKALAMYERAHQLDPTDPDLYMNLSLVAWKLGQLEAAEQFIRLFIQMRPTHHSGYNNLGGILRDQGRYQEAIETIRNAIYQIPNNEELWNTMGTIAMEDGNYTDARTFYEEAIRLRPKYARALHNIAYAVHHTGPLDEALRFYNLSLKYAKNPNDIIETKHSRSLCLLGMGKLAEGWPEWDVRLDPTFRGSILYAIDAPRWQGEDLNGKCLLAIGEQGLGDEIMFANAYRELIGDLGPDGHLIIACDARLAPLFQRALPKAEIISYANRQHNGKTARWIPEPFETRKPDFYAPCGATLEYKRSDIQAFPTDQSLFKADPDRIAHWKERLASLGDGPYVGICWRSLIMNAKRSKYFSPMDHWAPVFKNEDIKFINLQYGDCDDDIAYVRDKFGVTIHDFDEIDLKNDLDDNAALCNALDLVLSAPTAAGALAGASGAQVWLLAIGDVWPMLGTDHFPFFPNNRVLKPDTYADWGNLMSKVGAELNAFRQQRKPQ